MCRRVKQDLGLIRRLLSNKIDVPCNIYSGVTSHRQPGKPGAQGPKTVKGAQSDPN